jgi:alpha-tubulin suppressor-like RCC1 family protein
MFDFNHLLYKIINFSLFRNFPPQYNKSVHFQIPFTNIPLKLEVPHVRTVASGLRHSAILTTDGLVMVCGNGKNGQLGLTDNNGIPVAEVEQPQESM